MPEALAGVGRNRGTPQADDVVSGTDPLTVSGQFSPPPPGSFAAVSRAELVAVVSPFVRAGHEVTSKCRTVGFQVSRT
jgi:hypothetical protein